MSQKTTPIPQYIGDFISYDPETGIFTNKVTRGPRAQASDETGYLNKANGYICIGFEGKVLQSHRVAWFLHTGQDPDDRIVDHKNRITTDNRFINLRLATEVQRGINTSPLGYYYNKGAKQFHVRSRLNGKHIFLGLSKCPLLARTIYHDFVVEHHGEFAPPFYLDALKIVGWPHLAPA